MDSKNRYFAISVSASELIGHCCFGEDAQVPGGDYQLEACDVGIGLDPTLIGKGMGKAFFQAIINFGILSTNSSVYRVTVAAFNSRAIHLYESAGFVKVSDFVNKIKNTKFIIMVRSIS